jgi:hypothetical protein
MTVRSLVQSEISHDTAHQTQCQHKQTTMTIFRTVHCANQINVCIWSLRWLRYYNYYYGDTTGRSAELLARERERGRAANVCQTLVLTSCTSACKKWRFVGSDVLTVVVTNVAIFCYIAPCSPCVK